MKEKTPRAVPVAIGAVFGPKGMLLIRRENEPFAGLWGLPGGKVHYGEHVEAAIERELREEAGVRVRFCELRGVVSELLYDRAKLVMHYLLFVCRLDTQAVRLRPSDEGEVRWFGPAELAALREQMIPSDYVMLDRLVAHRPQQWYFRCVVRRRAGAYRVERFD